MSFKVGDKVRVTNINGQTEFNPNNTTTIGLVGTVVEHRPYNTLNYRVKVNHPDSGELNILYTEHELELAEDKLDEIIDTLGNALESDEPPSRYALGEYILLLAQYVKDNR